MKQYRWKPPKLTPEKPGDDEETTQRAPAGASAANKVKKLPLVQSNEKKTIMKTMGVEHPTISMDIGTLEANAMRANADTAQEVTRIFNEIVEIVASTKRRCQLLIGKYIELVTASAQLLADDKALLDLMCPRILKSDLESSNDNDQAVVDETEESDQQKFYSSLMTYLHSNNLPQNKNALKFVSRLETLGLVEKKDRGALNSLANYPGTNLFRTAGGQLARELESHYKNGAVKIHQKVKRSSPFFYRQWLCCRWERS